MVHVIVGLERDVLPSRNRIRRRCGGGTAVQIVAREVGVRDILDLDYVVLSIERWAATNEGTGLRVSKLSVLRTADHAAVLSTAGQHQ